MTKKYDLDFFMLKALPYECSVSHMVHNRYGSITRQYFSDEVDKWCAENIKHMYYVDVTSVHFERQEDAILYKLSCFRIEHKVHRYDLL